MVQGVNDILARRLYALRRPRDICVPSVDEEVRAVAVALQSEATTGQQLRGIETTGLDEVFQFFIG